MGDKTVFLEEQVRIHDKTTCVLLGRGFFLLIFFWGGRAGQGRGSNAQKLFKAQEKLKKYKRGTDGPTYSDIESRAAVHATKKGKYL